MISAEVNPKPASPFIVTNTCYTKDDFVRQINALVYRLSLHDKHHDVVLLWRQKKYLQFMEVLFDEDKPKVVDLDNVDVWMRAYREMNAILCLVSNDGMKKILGWN